MQILGLGPKPCAVDWSGELGLAPFVLLLGAFSLRTPNRRYGIRDPGIEVLHDGESG